jgi:ribonuclease R
MIFEAIKDFPDDIKKVISENLYSHQLVSEWPSEIAKELESISENIECDECRKDLTEYQFFTIDNTNTKEFDDALCCIKNKSGWKLFVSIADVSWYVREGSVLDKEAAKRGNSYYFASIQIPMLPPELTTVVCSLKPNKKRYCLTVEIDVNFDGSIAKYKFYPSIIKSNYRLTYKEANALVKDHFAKKCQSVLSTMLFNLNQLTYKRKKLRTSSTNYISIKNREPMFLLNENGSIKNIFSQRSTKAHSIVEESMILANTCVADFLTKRTNKLIYRVENIPDLHNIEKFNKMVSFLGYKISTNKADIVNYLSSIWNNNYFAALEQLLLRNLPLGYFSTVNVGHFLLNTDKYVCFTSPIRRYADLVTHRIIKQCLKDSQKAQSIKLTPSVVFENIGEHQYSLEQLEKIAKHCSKKEYDSLAATNAINKKLQCYYLETLKEDLLTGTIINITRFGFYVFVDRLNIDAFVPIECLGETASFNENNYTIKDNSKTFFIGRRATLRLKSISKSDGCAQFDVVDA